MLKYASGIFLRIFLSVLATVIGSYLAHQYIADRPVPADQSRLPM
jgi:hypothetical protein